MSEKTLSNVGTRYRITIERHEDGTPESEDREWGISVFVDDEDENRDQLLELVAWAVEHLVGDIARDAQ